MITNLSIAASGLRHQQARLQGAAHNVANQAAVPSATATVRVHASELEGGGVESRTHAQPLPADGAVNPSGELLTTGILPLLTAPNHANGLAHIIRAQDEMTGILLDITA